MITRIGGEFLVNSSTAGAQSEPVVSALPGGGFVLAWIDELGDSDGYGIKARLFDAAGSPVGLDFDVNSSETKSQFQPTVTTLASGGFVIAWSDDNGQEDGTSTS